MATSTPLLETLALPDAMKKKLDGLVAEHSIWHSRSTLGNYVPTEEERSLARACAEENVPFVSSRDKFVAMRARFVHPRGFHNTLPGEGHLNELGHRVFAAIAMSLLREVDARPRTGSPAARHTGK